MKCCGIHRSADGDIFPGDDISLRGSKIFWDLDKDTYTYAIADDLWALYVGAALVFTAEPNRMIAYQKLSLIGNELLLDADADTGIVASADDVLTWKFGDADSFQFILDMIHGLDKTGDANDLTVRGGDSTGLGGDGGDLNLEAGALNGAGADGSVNLRKADGTNILGVAAAGNLYVSLLAAKGDLMVASADDTPARLTVGSNEEILEADSAQSLGAIWKVPMQLCPLPFNERLSNRAGTHNLQAIGCDTDFGRNNRAVLLAAGTVIAFTYRMLVTTATSGQLDFTLWVNDVWNSVMVSQLASSGTGYFAINTTGLSVAFVAGGELAIRVVETGTMVWGPIWGLLWVKMRV